MVSDEPERTTKYIQAFEDLLQKYGHSTPVIAAPVDIPTQPIVPTDQGVLNKIRKTQDLPLSSTSTPIPTTSFPLAKSPLVSAQSTVSANRKEIDNIRVAQYSSTTTTSTHASTTHSSSHNATNASWWAYAGITFFLIWLFSTQENQKALPVSPSPAQPTYTKQTTPSSVYSTEGIDQRANLLYKQGHYTESFPLVEQLAKQNNAYWQRHLGDMFANGQGTPQDYQQAAHWYQKAAAQGDTDARVALNKISSKQAQVRLKIQTQIQSEAQVKTPAKVRLKDNPQPQVEAKTQAQLKDRVQEQSEAQIQAQLEAQVEALAQLETQAKAATNRLGTTLPDGGIVFYVDSSGSHGLEAKAADETDLLDWVDAIDAARDYGFGWRLPTRDELRQLYNQKTVVGGFTAGDYWSSTKSGSLTAWRQNFGNGEEFYHSKDDTLRVRAVRVF